MADTLDALAGHGIEPAEPGQEREDGLKTTFLADPADEPPGSAKYYTDVNACADEAWEAAGDQAVLVHGAGAAQALLAAGQLAELELHLVPVLLGDGRRLFEPTGLGHVELELVRRLEGRNATHLRYRVSTNQ
jgi:dihydrofolate reductase